MACEFSFVRSATARTVVAMDGWSCMLLIISFVVTQHLFPVVDDQLRNDCADSGNESTLRHAARDL